MDCGKMVAQGAHASVNAYVDAGYMDRKLWLFSGQKKIVLKVYSEDELLQIYKKAKSMKLPCSIIKDAGKTQIKPGTYTAVGIGPCNDKKANIISSKLKLL